MGVLYSINLQGDIRPVRTSLFERVMERHYGCIVADDILGKLYAGYYTLDTPFIHGDNGYYFNASN